MVLPETTQKATGTGYSGRPTLKPMPDAYSSWHARACKSACARMPQGFNGRQTKHLESEALSRQAVDAEHDEMCFSKKHVRARECSSDCIVLLDGTRVGTLRGCTYVAA